MKRLLLLFSFLIIFNPISYCAIVTGGVEYNQETAAAEEVFQNPPASINFNFIRTHFIDPNNSENLTALSAGLSEIKNRKLAKFSDGTYGVIYNDDLEYSWYYTSNGRLINFTHKSSLSYPCKITKYKPDGSVANTGLKVSENESYIFAANGKLIAHWKGNVCLDENNNIIMLRKYVE